MLSRIMMLYFLSLGHNISSKSAAIRLIFLTSYLTAVLLFAIYSAAFISHLTVRNPTLPFTGFEGFIQDGTYQITSERNSAQLDYFKVRHIN
jgi:hypothetical protein